jgi:hypothetical protein
VRALVQPVPARHLPRVGVVGAQAFQLAHDAVCHVELALAAEQVRNVLVQRRQAAGHVVLGETLDANALCHGFRHVRLTGDACVCALHSAGGMHDGGDARLSGVALGQSGNMNEVPIQQNLRREGCQAVGVVAEKGSMCRLCTGL